jgi:hypothetical protein
MDSIEKGLFASNRALPHFEARAGAELGAGELSGRHSTKIAGRTLLREAQGIRAGLRVSDIFGVSNPISRTVRERVGLLSTVEQLIESTQDDISLPIGSYPIGNESAKLTRETASTLSKSGDDPAFPV